MNQHHHKILEKIIIAWRFRMVQLLSPEPEYCHICVQFSVAIMIVQMSFLLCHWVFLTVQIIDHVLVAIVGFVIETSSVCLFCCVSAWIIVFIQSVGS